jgi:hypothetical protein
MPNWLVDALGAILNGLALIVLGIWTAVLSAREAGKRSSSGDSHKIPSIHVVLLGILIGLIAVSLVFQLVAAHHQVYDTDLARYYEDKFNKDMTQKRYHAALALKEYYQKGSWSSVTNSTTGLDYVLGFFEDLGYDEQHGRISPQVAHQ